MDTVEFLRTYDGNDAEPARTRYRELVGRADADFEVLDELTYNDREMLLDDIAQTLVLAERIAYRFQAINRTRLYDGAIFIEDDDQSR
ncbi:hypothetical protein HGO34_15200 [Agrobacterium vitis]|uniref:Uncharacterized protein n=1 Tax=Agrobacterium vitis TaxID=373 RepID=A0AAE5AWI8_AGRVI|nr:hypothetical protein [Agrobacterium vitis]MCF1499028.1 hypothetical protein [Allorhizobium sp. Av2]MCM2441066.1 hypothetical protein [Agrobacterium vitis]MUZ58476.1 hypothetical protein [Agrobacterium vitis]MVA65830.1 hypothetical protein [Agrobacterium vitis]MVA88148.1 hypothetical protein [Agrobacterium vitis]